MKFENISPLEAVLRAIQKISSKYTNQREQSNMFHTTAILKLKNKIIGLIVSRREGLQGWGVMAELTAFMNNCAQASRSCKEQE